ncbi:MAG TPA: hypothetical protein VHZ30_02815, partial [Verrucomicrobiae bacterium]|nr:hypothetical protein [Verrucomicrobiae bacterium]
ANVPGLQSPVYTTSVTFVNGQASLLATTLYDAQTTTITPSISGLTGVASASLTVIPAAANQIAFTAQPSPVTVAGVAFAQQPVVTIQDQFGNTVTSGADATKTVALTLTGGVGVLGGTVNMNATAGVATFIGLNINLVGNDKVLTATATLTAGLRTTTTSPAFTIIPAAASQIVFTTQPSPSTVMGIAFAEQPVVTVEDQFGNTVTSALDQDSTAMISLTLTTGSGLLGGTASIPAVGGVADFSSDGLNVSLPGNDDVLTATATLTTAGTVTAMTSPAFSILPNAPPTANAVTLIRAENTQLLIDVTSFLSTNTSDLDGDAVMLVSVNDSPLVDGTTFTTLADGSTFFYSRSFEGKPHLLFTSPNNNPETINYVVGDAIFPTLFTAQNTITINTFTATGQMTGSITYSSGTITTTWAGIPGDSYVVQRSTDLINWVDASAPITAPASGLGGGVFTYSETPPAGPTAYFYQLRQY